MCKYMSLGKTHNCLVSQVIFIPFSHSLSFSTSRKMQFRRALFLAVRICQWSGLCPISVYGSNVNATIENRKIHFASLSAVHFIVQLIFSIYTFMVVDYSSQWYGSKLILCTVSFVSFVVRIHAGVVLIESYANRSIHFELLQKLDEIETILVGELKTKINHDRLKRRFCRFIIVWIVLYFGLYLTITFKTILTSDWYYLREFVSGLISCYISSLFFGQYLVYLDVLKYIIEMTNSCLAKLKDSPQFYRLRPHRQHIESRDICQQLTDLRNCYCKIWKASVLINRCFQWSLLLGVITEFSSSIVSLYWILYTLFNSTPEMDLMMVLTGVAVAITMSNLVLISIICEQIWDQVSTLGFGSK